MNISDINKVTSRNRLSANADKLREKIARENKNVIKLRVAQDTAYWDVREQLRQVESNHEKLQANMVEVQMQHEAISGQYHDELRLRPETLNKLTGTRQICDVLEEYSERLRDTLSRCKADQATLYDAYQKSGQLVRDITSQHQQAEDKQKQLVDNLHEKIKLTSEHNTQLLHYFGTEKQRTDAELVDVKAKLEASLLKRDELVATSNDLARKLDQSRSELQKKEDTINGLQRDIKQLIQEFNNQAGEMKNTLLKQEKDLKECSAANESLKQAVRNQEEFTKSVCEQSNQLQEKIAALEDEAVALKTDAQLLNDQIKTFEVTNENLKKDLQALLDVKQNLDNDIVDKNEHLSKAEQEICDLKEQLSSVKTEKDSVTNDLAKAEEEAATMAAKVQELVQAATELDDRIAVMDAKLQECRETSDQKIQELTETIASKDKELDSKTTTVTHLMSEMKAEADAGAKLRDALLQVRKELETEKDAANDRETAMMNQIEQLNNVVKDKEKELSTQMNIILELRSIKERLQDKIQSMQNKIDNIQKELTGPAAPKHLHQPEHDDNAVMLTPTNSATAPQKGTLMKPPPVSSVRPFAVPYEPKLDNIFNFLSDSSMDGDNSLDPVEVNRRFEALSRGERLSPLPVLKRRRSGQPVGQGGLRLRNKEQDSVPLAQLKEDLKNKEKSFFKTKRNEKMKKLKQPIA